jgi:uncharacterized protein (TIGR02246 family)
MRNALVAGFVAALAVPSVVYAQQSSAADETAIRRLIQQHDDTRSKGEWNGVGDLFLEDGAVLTSSGEWRRGRAQISKGGARAGAGAYKGGKYTTKVESIRMLAPTVALADSTFEISNIGGTRSGNTTYVLVKSGDTWRIAAARSMVPAAVGPTPQK